MNEKEMIHTEEYILQEEEDRILWEENYGIKRDTAIELAKLAIRKKGHLEIKALEDLFQDDDMVNALSEVSEIAFIMVMLGIYNAEKASGVGNTVLDWGDSLEELVAIIRQIKFLLWEIEFLNDKEAGLMLLNYIKDKSISMPALEYIIFISSYDKNKAVRELEKLFADASL